MKNLNILLMLLWLITIPIYAEEHSKFTYRGSEGANFPAYIDWIRTTHNIYIDKPARCLDLKVKTSAIHLSVGSIKSAGVGGLYGPVFRTRDKNCIIFFPSSATSIMPNQRDTRYIIKLELYCNLGITCFPWDMNDIIKEGDKVDLDDYVTIIGGERARTMFNADTIYIYKYPNQDMVEIFDYHAKNIKKWDLKKAYKKDYSVCVAIRKQGYVDLFVKLLLSDRGMKNLDKYIDMLSGNIWYIDES